MLTLDNTSKLIQCMYKLLHFVEVFYFHLHGEEAVRGVRVCRVCTEFTKQQNSVCQSP